MSDAEEEKFASPREITKCNYEEVIPELVERIKKADFVAIDATIETTGFVMINETFNVAYMKDRSNCFGEWYDNIKTHEKTRCLVEIGVAVFNRMEGKSDELEVECFQIPILPACVDDNEIARFRGSSCTRVRFDGYGQEFMTLVNFDVNKTFYMGAPFLNRQLQEQGDKYMKEHPDFMVVARKRRLNQHLMPVIYDEVTEKERQIIIERLKGVSKIIECIAACNTPVVGHNLFLKLLFMYKDFIEYLPDTYLECIDKIRNVFPLVYDTKQMAHVLSDLSQISPRLRNKLRDTRLYELLRNLSLGGVLDRKFEVGGSENCEVYFEDVKDIRAGGLLEEDRNSYCYVASFDALVSGLLFLDLVNLMQINKVEPKQIGNEEEKSEDENLDYLNVFVRGDAVRFRNVTFGQPERTLNQELIKKKTKEKKMMRRKLEEEEKSKAKPKIIDYSKVVTTDWPVPSMEPRKFPG